MPETRKGLNNTEVTDSPQCQAYVIGLRTRQNNGFCRKNCRQQCNLYKLMTCMDMTYKDKRLPESLKRYLPSFSSRFSILPVAVIGRASRISMILGYL